MNHFEQNAATPEPSSRINRRRALQLAAGAGAAAIGARATAAEEKSQSKRAIKGRINQSLVHWCYKSFFWSVEEMAQLARQLGCRSIELIAPEHWPVLKQYGLTCAIAGSHSFKVGMNDPANWEMCIDKMRQAIDASAEFGCPNVISFTGYRGDLSDEEGAKNCVAGYKKIIGYAEKKKVNICLEMLNTRDDTHPMKGHPGYQGDHTEYCIDIIKRVGSPRMKLLFDIYHVQIMDGDVIRRIREHKDYIAHIHTAGNPGRAELDDQQEINYPPIMQALLEIGYTGYVGQEFIPVRDPRAGLEQAVTLCDV